MIKIIVHAASIASLASIFSWACFDVSWWAPVGNNGARAIMLSALHVLPLLLSGYLHEEGRLYG